jgi:arylsulfatase
MAHSMPHVPIAVSSAFKGKSGAGLFGDVMMEIDWSVGEIMKTLDEQKLSDNNYRNVSQ